MARYWQRRRDHQDLGSTVRQRFVIPYHRKQAKITVHAPRSSHIQRNYDNEAPGKPSIYSPLRARFGSTLTVHSFLVNDVVVHPNQGELISCDQAGRIKQWDLSENSCTHELVSLPHMSSSTSMTSETSLHLHICLRLLLATFLCVP